MQYYRTAHNKENKNSGVASQQFVLVGGHCWGPKCQHSRSKSESGGEVLGMGLTAQAPPSQLGSLGERCKLSPAGFGWSPNRKCILDAL